MEIIANPLSGKNRGAEVIQQIKKYLDGRNISYNLHLTQEQGHGQYLARELCRKGASTIVAIGGDGTFHEVLNGMDFSKSRLGLIPSGRGNDYATGTGLNMNPVETLAPIIAGIQDETDYIQVGTARCLNVGGTGLDVVVLEHTANKNNSISYVTSLVHCLLKFNPYQVQVEVEGETKTYDCVMAGVCNGSQFGGGIKLCPPANNRDGLLDVIIMCKPKHVPTLAIMPGFVKGKHMGKPYTTHFTCSRVKITTPAPIQLDGEIYQGLDFDARIVKGGCKTFARHIL